mmetsp:Transcript_38385/g.121266  ORF Transcript_38385/g.121266 Transcript_38385/m.121266 type:complete len:221 (+) Transcript_38385:338-1000(+)
MSGGLGRARCHIRGHLIHEPPRPPIVVAVAHERAHEMRGEELVPEVYCRPHTAKIQWYQLPPGANDVHTRATPDKPSSSLCPPISAHLERRGIRELLFGYEQEALSLAKCARRNLAYVRLVPPFAKHGVVRKRPLIIGRCRRRCHGKEYDPSYAHRRPLLAASRPGRVVTLRSIHRLRIRARERVALLPGRQCCSQEPRKVLPIDDHGVRRGHSEKVWTQ